MVKPIGYFASVPSGTSDAAYLSQIEQQFGSYLEHLPPAQVAAWIITLVREAVEPQGIEVEIEIDNCDLKLLLNLSVGAKLDLAAAALSYLRERTHNMPSKVGLGTGKQSSQLLQSASTLQQNCSDNG